MKRISPLFLAAGAVLACVALARGGAFFGIRDAFSKDMIPQLHSQLLAAEPTQVFGTATFTPDVSPTPSYTASPTPSDSPSSTATFTASPTRSYTFTASPSASPTGSKTPSFTASPTATATFTNSPLPSATPTFTASPTPTFTASPTPTSTASPTATFTASPTATFTASPTPTFTASPTATFSASPTPTSTASYTDSFTASPTGTFTASPTPTFTASPTATFTASPTPTFTGSPTPTFTASPSPTSTATPVLPAYLQGIITEPTLSTTETIPYTPGNGTNEMLCVTIAFNGDNGTTVPTAVKWNSAAMTLMQSRQPSSYLYGLQVWMLPIGSPGTTPGTVSITQDSGVSDSVVGISEYQGVLQAPPTNMSSAGSLDQPSGQAATVESTLIGVGTNSLVFTCYSGTPLVSFPAGTTQRLASNSTLDAVSFEGAVYDLAPATVSSYDFTFTSNPQPGAEMIMIELPPAP